MTKITSYGTINTELLTRRIFDIISDKDCLDDKRGALQKYLETNLQGAHVPPNESFVLMRRLAAIGGEQHTLEAVAKELGVSRARIRQIEAKALERIRCGAQAFVHKQKQYDPR